MVAALLVGVLQLGSLRVGGSGGLQDAVDLRGALKDRPRQIRHEAQLLALVGAGANLGDLGQFEESNVGIGTDDRGVEDRGEQVGLVAKAAVDGFDGDVSSACDGLDGGRCVTRFGEQRRGGVEDAAFGLLGLLSSAGARCASTLDNTAHLNTVALYSDSSTLLWLVHRGAGATLGPPLDRTETTMPNFPLIPGRTALINVDMQNCFVADSPLASPDGLDLVPRVNRLAEACRAAGILVVHTRGWMRADWANLGVMGEIVPPFLVAMYTEGAPEAELHPSLVVDDRDVVLGKPRYGAFHGTDLETILRSRGVDTVIISGIATNICCDTTAREAAQRDLRVFFLSDGTATQDMNGVPSDELQRATCASLGMVFAQVLTVAEITEKIGTAAREAAGAAERNQREELTEPGRAASLTA